MHSPPEGDSDPVKQLLDAGGGVLGVESLGNGLPEIPNGGDGVLSQSSQTSTQRAHAQFVDCAAKSKVVPKKTPGEDRGAGYAAG